jgi:hypothetical protein
MVDRHSLALLAVLGGAVFGLAALPLPGQALAESVAWDSKYWNPNALEDDLVLPMPCGGAMAFRPVRTPNSEGAIGDVPILLGQEGGDQPFLTGLRRSYVSGAFADPGDKTVKGLFYMGKYELAQAQYDVVMSETCPDKEPRKRDFLPATGLSKLDFEAFAERYTLWLMKSASASLPEAGTTGAYLRLPTEEEWEFAARGGLAVEGPLFRSTLPPIPEGRSQNEFIASAGNDSAGGKVQVVGTLQPNPLGLHDMLGNVAEYVQSPFSLVRHGRLHGQAGGIVKRGGDARTPLDRISSALRLEVPPFDVLNADVMRDDYTGARFVLAGLSIATREQSEEIVTALDALARADAALSTAASEGEVLDLLDRLASGSADQEASQYRLIADTIRAARAENNEQRDRSIRLILDSAVRSCDLTVGRYLNSLAIGALLPGYDQIEAEAKANGDQATLDELDQARAEADAKLADLRALIDREIMDYASLIEGLAAEFSLELLKQQADAIQPETEARGVRRADCLIAAKAHVTDRSKAGNINIEKVDQDMRDIALSLSK